MKQIRARGSVDKKSLASLPLLPPLQKLNLGGVGAKAAFMKSDRAAFLSTAIESLGKDYEPSLDVYIAHANQSILRSRHPSGARIRFRRGNADYEFQGGQNTYVVYEL